MQCQGTMQLSAAPYSIPLAVTVSSSTAAPGVAPPVEIAGSVWVDGACAPPPTPTCSSMQMRTTRKNRYALEGVLGRRAGCSEAAHSNPRETTGLI